MLQHNKNNEKSQPNTFIDGVKVKISEQYKPPRKIVLPVSCQNCSPGEVLFSEYDPRLEKNILSKLAEWKSTRREQIERRKERLKNDVKVCEEIEHFSNISTETTQSEGMEQTHQSQLNHILTDLVLTPVCAKQNFPTHNPVSSKFNLSDFESDNSSPFDNMELKTINDMEVLASILSTNNMKQSLHNNNNIFDKDVGKSCVVLNNKNNEWGYSPMNGYDNISYSNLEYNHSVIPSQHKNLNQFDFYSVSENNQISNYGLNDFSNQFGAAVSLDRSSGVINKQEQNILGRNKPCSINKVQADETNSKSVPDIMLELDKELKENKERGEEIEKKNKLVYLKQIILSSGIVDTAEFPESSRKIQDCKTLSKLSDPFFSLKPSSQKLVHYISEMGFPLARVARACEMFDDNEKKIIEFLLQVQSIEEKNYPGDLVEKALVINNFNLMDSFKYLEAMVVLLDLGFAEEKVEEALIATNSDRDKALDMLIL